MFMRFLLILTLAASSHAKGFPQQILDAKTITVIAVVDEAVGRPDDESVFQDSIEAELRHWGKLTVVSWESGADLVMIVRIGATGARAYASMSVTTSNREKKAKSLYRDTSISSSDPIAWVLTRFEREFDSRKR